MTNRVRRKEFTKTTKARRFEHCEGKCEMCGAKLRPGQFDYHHMLEAAILGENTFENCRVLCKTCHKRQTRKRAPVLSKVKRIAYKHMGIRRETRPIPGSKRSRFRKGFDGIVRDRETGEPVNL